MSSSQLGIVKSKRLRIDTGGKEPYPKAGFAFNNNPTSVNPGDANSVIGSNSIPKSGGTNDDVHAKFIIVPTKHPLGNHWAENLPLGSICYTRNCRARKLRTEKFSNNDDGNVRGVFKESDRVEILTPHRVNFHLHRDRIMNPRAMNRPLYEIFTEWSVAGVMGSAAVTEHKQSPYVSRISEERYVDIRPLTDGRIVNDFGEQVAGDVNSFLWHVLIEVDLQGETCYVTDVEREGVFNLGNMYTDQEEVRRMLVEGYEFDGLSTDEAKQKAQANLAKYLRCQHAPRLVARYSQTNYLPKSAREYKIKLYDPETDTTEEITRYGYAVKIGRCKVNPVFNEKIAINGTYKEGEMRDMSRSWLLPKLDVQVEICETFIN